MQCVETLFYVLYIVHTAQNSFQKCSEIFITSFVTTLGLNIYSSTIIVKVNQSYHWTEKYYLFYISISYLIQIKKFKRCARKFLG